MSDRKVRVPENSDHIDKAYDCMYDLYMCMGEHCSMRDRELVALMLKLGKEELMKKRGTEQELPNLIVYLKDYEEK